ncbi:Protein PLM2 [Tolypocladium paradoxum]|uniref:Protein PLM2 n=1 Tax=Tolypocladium paradoxum TaxID=94208 RepID=A0A2S4KQX4_9HYPO|nr:Protein PLM2 [Tolypocladium paradoxum]
MQNLPGEARVGGLTRAALRDAIEAAPSVGIIRRQGKDAAGKPLESEYYYVAEGDDDEQRRAAVVDGLRERRSSTHAEADAARAMDHTNSWTPSRDRRQSWSKEDQKHAAQMSTIDDVQTGPGFTEKRS